MAEMMPPQDMPAEEAAETGTPAGGYCIELYAYADGTYAVEGPEPIETAEEEAGEKPGGEKAAYETLEQALKAIISAVKSNPVTVTEQDQFDAGYKAQ